ncbi:MAG: GIY-YIG nuclease family protein [Chitinophagaceae bacterium]|nr:GIY-YIG nuclease family protein [Chitinophagaceae bacterium]
MPLFFVYIIYSQKLDKYYIGYTSDLQKRLSEHNSGFSSFTASADDWTLKYSESYPDRESAMKREKEIKSKKSRKYIEWLINSVG